MTRRDLTLWLSGGLSVLLLGIGGVTTVPYVELSPGPAINTLGLSQGKDVLGITGAKTYATEGELDLTTVSVRDKLTLFEALKGWVSSRDAVIPREFVYPDDKSAAENEAETQQEMTTSQSAATGAALTQLGLSRVKVQTVTKGGGSDGALKVGDVIETIDGTKVFGPGPLRTLVRKHAIGEKVVVGYRRAGVDRTSTITTGASQDKPVKAALGIVTELTSDVKVDITLSDIGGPSAGLMFALGIIDKLGPASLTGGRHIAGTGTIDLDGVVGPIGGIAEKLLGARDKGATVFLVPVDNCREAASHHPKGLTLVRVGSLQDALNGLAAVRAGKTPRSC
ncbi:MAG: Secreted protein [Frankiales bacterium]|nr:Secreted protein [Frankiales bacterium]